MLLGRLERQNRGWQTSFSEGLTPRAWTQQPISLMRLQGAKVYPKFEDISPQDETRWTDGERIEKTARSVCQSDIAQYTALANGVELASANLLMLGKGLASIVGWLMEPLAIDPWTREDVL
jgi:hypothetical protein